MQLFVAGLERLHGAELARSPLSEAKSPYLLDRMVQERRLRIDIPKQMVNTWWTHDRRSPEDAGERAHSVEDRESVYGDSIRHLSQEYPTAHLLSNCLRQI